VTAIWDDPMKPPKTIETGLELTISGGLNIERVCYIAGVLAACAYAKVGLERTVEVVRGLGITEDELKEWPNAQGKGSKGIRT